MRYAVLTFGCRVNQADSMALEAELRARGAHEAPAEAADVVIVNTCAVTASAEQGARQTVRRIARANPAARIVVTGCFATRSGREIGELPGVVAVVPNAAKDRLAEVVRTLAPESSSSAAPNDGDGPCGHHIEPGLAGRTVFLLRVQTGCAEPCAYCIIPSTRGAPRSLTPDEVWAAVTRACDAGYREIVLTGVHLGSYGRDLHPAISLERLLARLVSHPSDLRFRVSSLEPMDCTPGIVELVAATGRIAPHFHLPLQHASDRVLERMRRPYDLAAYDALVSMIRATLPDAAIGTDLLVGFPGEDDDDHERLVSWLSRSPLTSVHVFPYSDRPGTAASTLAGRPPGSVVRARAAQIRAIGNALQAAFHERQDGSIRRALTLDDGRVALTDNFLKVRIGPGYARNEWIDVRVRRDGTVLCGDVVPRPAPAIQPLESVHSTA